jgi:hypothetical protein
MNKHMKNFSHTILNRRIWLIGAFTFPYTAAATQLQTNLVEVWKDLNCGCCKDWVTILEKSGFTVRVFDSGNEAMRAQLGIPVKLGSCHTARVGGYAIEGHVPVREIRRLLREQPKAIGLTVPGMVVGSPGMDGSVYKGRKDPYSVLLVHSNGESSIFQKYDTSVNSAPTSKTKT